MLGAMGATSQLLALYHDTNSHETKAEVIGGLIPAGPKGRRGVGFHCCLGAGSGTAAKSDPQPWHCGRHVCSSLAGRNLQEERRSGDQKAVAQALFLAGDSHDLVELARAEKDPGVKQSIVQQLSLMHSKEATDYMLEILNK